MHSDKMPRSMWRMGVVTELIKGKMDNNIRGALVRLSNNSLLKRPVNKLYPIEYVRSNRQEPADTGNLTRSRQVTTKICRMNIGRNIGPQYLVGSVRAAVQKPLYYVIDIFHFLSNTCKYFQLVEKKQSYSPLVFFKPRDSTRITCFYLKQSCFKKQKEVWGQSPYLILCIISEEKYVSCYVLSIDQVSLSGCRYFSCIAIVC